MAEPREERDAPNDNIGWRPVPDPTLLTTQQLEREIGGLREFLETKFDTRLSAMDEAVRLRYTEMSKDMQLLREDCVKEPLLNQERIEHLREVIFETFRTQNEKFHGVETQFTERDVRTRDAASQTALAVQAALQAAKEAVGEQNKSFTLSIDKSEKSTSEQITQQRVLLQTNYGSLNDKIVDLAVRMTRFEGLGLGVAQAETSNRADHTTHLQASSLILAATGFVVGTLIGTAGIIIAILHH